MFRPVATKCPLDKLRCYFINSIRTLVRLLEAEQLLKLTQLPLEAHVGKDDWPTFASELEGFLKFHVFLLHQVCNDAARASRYASVAVDEDATLGHALLDEGYRGGEVPDQA